LSEPDESDGSHWESGDLAVTVDDVKAALSDFSFVDYYKGWIPDRFPDVSDRTFSFVHVDVDLNAPTHDSMAFFYPRMNEGGIILCDDYGGSSCVGATQAVDSFLSDKPEKMIALASNGGFMIKGRSTTPGQEA
jgi:O-methyltransferase